MNTVCRAMMFVVCILSCYSNANELQVSLSPFRDTVEIGNPCFIELKFVYSKPHIDMGTGLPYSAVRHYASAIITHQGDPESDNMQKIKLIPSYLPISDPNGYAYSETFVLFYNREKEQLIFNEPGVYEIKIKANPHYYSEPGYVTIKPPSAAIKKALTYLETPEDHGAVGVRKIYVGDRAFDERRARYAKIVEEFPDSLLGQWIAACQGIIYFEAFLNENGNVEMNRNLRRKQQLQSADFAEALHFLRVAEHLPDGLSVKEDVLYYLAGANYIDDKLEECEKNMTALVKAYPYGKHAEEIREGLKELDSIRTREAAGKE